MEEVKKILAAVRGKLTRAALKDVVVSKPLSTGDQHIVVLSEVSVGFGAGGGSGDDGGKRSTRGTGGGGGGGAKARPLAVLVVEQGKVRLETIGS